MKRTPKLATFNRVITTLIFAGIVVGLALFFGPVQAKVVAEADEPGGSGAVFVFHDAAGACRGNALLVEYVTSDGARMPGCYVPRGAALACVFFDTDKAVVPISALRPPKNV